MYVSWIAQSTQPVPPVRRTTLNVPPGSTTGKPRAASLRDTSNPPTVADRARQSNTNGTPYTGCVHSIDAFNDGKSNATPFGNGPLQVNTGYARLVPSFLNSPADCDATFAVSLEPEYDNGYANPNRPRFVPISITLGLASGVPCQYVTYPNWL